MDVGKTLEAVWIHRSALKFAPMSKRMVSGLGSTPFQFYAAIRRGRTFLRSLIITTLPKEIPDDETTKIFADLFIGLSKLGYEYDLPS